GQIPMYVAELSRNKAVALALRKAKVVDASGNDGDLSEYIGSDEEDAEAAEAAGNFIDVTDDAEEALEDPVIDVVEDDAEEAEADAPDGADEDQPASPASGRVPDVGVPGRCASSAANAHACRQAVSTTDGAAVNPLRCSDERGLPLP